MGKAVVYDLIARDHASRTMDRVGRRAGVLDRGLHKLGKAALYAGAAVGGALVVGLAESAKQAVDFQSKMLKIQTQAGATAKDVKVLSKAVLELGTKTQQGPQHLADSLYHLKSVGMDNTQAMKALKQASDLAAVGGADLEATTNALAGAWRTGIKGAGSFHDAVGTVNAIIGAGNMRMEDFNAAIGTGILPSAKTFGLSLSQVGSALALMTDEGIAADAAATRLRMTFSLLGAPSGAAEKQLKKIGLTGLDLAHAMRSKDGLIGAVQLLKDHLDKSGLSAERQSQLLSKAFGGGRSSSAILLMINNLDVLKKKQDQVNKSTGKFDDAVKAQRKTAQAQWKLLVSNLEVLSIKVGTKILPPLTHFVSYLGRTALPAVVSFGQGLVSRLLPKDGLNTAGKNFEDFLAGLTGKAAKVIPGPKIADVQHGQGGTPKTVMQRGPSTTVPLSQAQKFGQAIHDTVAKLVKDWAPLVKAAAGIALAFAKIVEHTPAPVFQTIVDVLIATAITTKILELSAAFKGLRLSMAALGTAKAGPVGLAVAGVSALVLLFGELLLPAHSVGGTLQFMGEGFAQIGRGLATAGRGIAHFFDRKNGILSNAVAGANHWLYGVGKDIIRGLWTGVKSMWDGMGAQFKGIKDAVVHWLVTSFGIASPSKVMMPIGANIIRGLLSGALGVAVGIGHWLLTHVKNPTTGFFGRAGGWLTGAGGRTVSGLLSGAGRVAGGIGRWFASHVKNPTTRYFSKSGSWLTKAGAAVISGLWTGMKGPWKSVTKWVSGIASWIKAHKGPISLDRKLLHPAGVALMHGLLEGLKFGFGPVGSFVYKAGSKLSDVIGGIGIGKGYSGSTAIMNLGKQMMEAQGWSADQWVALRALWQGESGWNPKAKNASSGAYGIPQALPANKMASAGSDWQTNPATQIKWGLSYIKSRYGSPGAAYNAWLGRSPHWYAGGTGGAKPGLAWVGEKGPELINLKGGEDILSHPDSMAFAKTNGIKLPGYASGTITNAADRVRRDRKRVSDARDAAARAKRRHKGEAAAQKRLKAAEKELKAAEIALSNARRSAKTSIANTIANGLLKTLSTGTSAAIASAVKSLTTKLLNAGFDKLAKSVMKSGAKLEKLADKQAALEKTIAAANQYAADQASNIKDFLSISGTSATSVGDLLSQMGGQQKTASSFVDLTKSLKARGASKALLQQLSDAGPGSQLATILSDKGVTTQDIAKLNKLIASGGKLATSFGRDMADMMYDSGKHAGEGFLAGLKAQEKSLQKEMDKLAKGMIKAIKKALKINSPSAVTRDEVGWEVGAGVVAGMDAHAPLIAAAASRMAATAAGVSIPRIVVPKVTNRARPGSSSGLTARQNDAFERLAAALENGSLNGSEVHVHFNDDRLKELIDVQVKPKIKASEQKQAYRAKVGRAA